ncbi:MAG: tRNA (N6-threonylcarbamoyladenosine(37)-N6)-methyltransferase TrmO [Deltaproteobacteria bacterium]|nr:MAG: tRNA (N6-threonylcarbamoyladenosine(37)-N6)-methyltransferase TrmO [Deltaproteobacteria bacterium]
MQTDYCFTPIGTIHSCFTEKFGIPRQPGLASEARATLEIHPPYDKDEAFAGIDGFSHIWIVFIFHGIPPGKWQPTVRPPRLGGNRRAGLFASRSPFRPNPVGLSVVRLNGIQRKKKRLCLFLSGIDLLDGTPVLDIKPYLPYVDSLPEAAGGFAAASPRPALKVTFTQKAKQDSIFQNQRHPGFTELLIEILEADPRPAYTGSRPGKSEYGVKLYDVNVRWTVEDETVVVQSVEKLQEGDG